MCFYIKSFVLDCKSNRYFYEFMTFNRENKTNFTDDKHE